jgi:ubiquinone/menaquinone biosynthesis C-methylase UbiE
VEDAVRRTYAQGARHRVAGLCCPVEYDPRYLEAIPDEVLERDYGCGDPSRHLRPGERVLDLGSGTGKICFIASQVVGREGRVIGVDMTPEMLRVARRAAPEVARRVGYANVEFRRGRIQDLALDLDRLDQELAGLEIRGADALFEAQARARHLRRRDPMIPDGAVDVVVSNCVLNLVESGAREGLVREIFRVLRRGGRAVISDIVSDEPVPPRLREDPELWSGCIAGAWTEEGFLRAFEAAGFHGVRIVERSEAPWRVVEGVEFRSVTLEAHTGTAGPCLERRQALVYRGPFRAVWDDDGHRFRRGERVAVCDKTYHLLRREPYGDAFLGVEPRVPVPLEEAEPFDCARSALRHPRETKGEDVRETTDPDGACCGPGEC